MALRKNIFARKKSNDLVRHTDSSIGIFEKYFRAFRGLFAPIPLLKASFFRFDRAVPLNTTLYTPYRLHPHRSIPSSPARFRAGAIAIPKLPIHSTPVVRPERAGES